MSSLSSLSDAQLAAIAGEIDPDTDALVRTVWGEARNQGPEGRKAVAAVIRNRANLTGRPIRAVVREPGQFEPWNDARVRPQLEGLDPASDAYLSILADVEAGDDPTGGATHFYAPKAQAALGRRAPAWDDGSGVDIGDHRFFRLSYGDQPVPESEAAPPPLEDMSDEELEAIAAGQEPAAAEARPSVDVGDVQFVDQPKTGLNPKAPFVYADDENPLTPDQVTTYERLIQSGKIDPESVRSGAARPGSEANPKAQRDPNDVPKPGDWYIDTKGKLLQVPEVPMLDTVVNMGRYLSNPVAANFEMDPRSEAMRRALESGVMLGGRNELVSGIEAIKRLAMEGVPLKEGFSEALEREDVSSARARRDFPIAYDASAVTGALASGAALPSGLGARVATGAGSGFLATDGGLKERAIGAGVGVLAGEALGAIAPRIARGAMDLTGIPLRQAGASSRGELQAAEAIQRALQRDNIAASDLGVPVVGGRAELPFQRGENLTGVADVLAQSPGEGRTVLRNAVRDSQAMAADDIKRDLAVSLGGKGDYFATHDAMQADRAAKAKPLMQEAFAQPIPAHVYDRKFAPIIARLPKGVLAEAYDIARRSGRNPEEIGLIVADRADGFAAGKPGEVAISAEDYNALKRGIQPKASRGPSLLSFISKAGGIRDFGGDLAAMDAQSWHKNKPFLSNLIKENGATVEEMARKAYDAGYFPEKPPPTMEGSENMQIVSPNELYAAINEEIAGRARYARDADEKVTQRAARLDDLERRLAAAGVDPHRMSLADARRALAREADDSAKMEAFAEGAPVGAPDVEQVMVANPTLETLHFIKKGLDQSLEKYRNPVTRQLDLSGSPGAQVDSQVRKAIAGAMRDVSPDYAQAMKLWGDDSDQLNALELGRNIFSPRFDMQAERLKGVVGEMSDAARENFRKGVGEALLYEVRTKGGVAEMRKLLKSEEFADRVKLAFPSDKAFGDFIDTAAKRVAQQDANARVIGGSQTYGRQAARADLEAQGRDPLDMAAEGIDLVLSPGKALTGKALKEALKTIPRKDRSVIGDPAANAALAKALTDDAEMTRLLNLLQVYKARREIPMLRNQGIPGGYAGALTASERR